MAASIFLAVLALFGLAISTTSAHPNSWSIARGLLPEDPTKDEFYQPPAGFESEAPGTILRNRTTITAIFGLVPNLVEAHQLLYRTTATNGSAITTVTTIFIPWDPKPNRFISWQAAYDSASVECSPSYQWQLGAVANDIIAPLQMVDNIEAYLIKGYIIASSDYEGPDAALGAGPLSGMATLDGMRAVVNFHDTLGLSDNPMIVGTGYSGAAIGTGWAAEMQPSYAPELNIKGWVVGGVPANISGTLEYLDDTLYSGFIPPILAGLAKPSAYGAQLDPVINRVFTANGREKLDIAESQCPIADILTFLQMSIFSTDIQSLGPALFHEPTVADVLSKNTMGVETPTAPVFLFHGAKDEVIPYANTPTLADTWCKNGADVKFTTYNSGGHFVIELIALPDVFKFTDAAFEGNTSSGCSRDTKLTGALNPLALGADLEPILIRLIEDLTNGGNKDNVSF